MKNKEQILKERDALIKKRDEYAVEVINLMEDIKLGKKSLTEADERLEEINKDMQVLLADMIKLAEEADYLSKHRHDIIS